MLSWVNHINITNNTEFFSELYVMKVKFKYSRTINNMYHKNIISISNQFLWAAKYLSHTRHFLKLYCNLKSLLTHFTSTLIHIYQSFVYDPRRPFTWTSSYNSLELITIVFCIVLVWTGVSYEWSSTILVKAYTHYK